MGLVCTRCEDARKRCCRRKEEKAGRRASPGRQADRKKQLEAMRKCVSLFDTAAVEELRREQECGEVSGLPAGRHNAIAALRLGGLERRSQLSGLGAADKELRAVFDIYDTSGNGVMNQIETQTFFDDYFQVSFPSLCQLLEELSLHSCVARAHEAGSPFRSPTQASVHRSDSSGVSRSHSGVRAQKVESLRRSVGDVVAASEQRARRKFVDHGAEIRARWLRYCDTAHDGRLQYSELQSALLGDRCAGFIELTLQAVGIEDELAEVERVLMRQADGIRVLDFHVDTPIAVPGTPEGRELQFPRHAGTEVSQPAGAPYGE